MYKIVKVWPDGYWSYVSKFDNSLLYLVREWTRPKIGKIFVFDTIDNTTKFLLKEGVWLEHFKVFECDVKLCEPLLKMSASMSDAFNFWSNPNKYLNDTPTGTYGASAVKLVQEIPLTFDTKVV